MTATFTAHAARRVLDRNLPAHLVLQAATEADARGIGHRKPEVVYRGLWALVLHQGRIITVWWRRKCALTGTPGAGGRRNRRNKHKRAQQRQARRLGQA